MTGVALVTGAGSGIGRAAARRIAADGFTVWLADIDGDAAAAAAADIALEHGRTRSARCDVSDAGQLGEVVEKIGCTDGQLDAVVANAAVFPRCSLDETDVDLARRVFEVNVTGAIATVMATRRLLAVDGGTVVMITSGAGGRSIARTTQQRGFALYGASKAALERWALGVCDELADEGIVIQLLCPGGVVDTDGTRAVVGDVVRAAGLVIAVVADAISHLCRVRDTAQTGARFLATELCP